VALVYANQTPDDILLREELEELAAAHPHKFRLWYTVDRDADETWKYSVGHINEEMLREHLLESGEDAVVGLCGPPGMIKFACIPNLEKMGYTEANIVQF
jgi:NAD(P)H-flavin reductase